MAAWPTELRFNKARAELLITFDDGGQASFINFGRARSAQLEDFPAADHERFAVAGA